MLKKIRTIWEEFFLEEYDEVPPKWNEETIILVKDMIEYFEDVSSKIRNSGLEADNVFASALNNWTEFSKFSSAKRGAYRHVPGIKFIAEDPAWVFLWYFEKYIEKTPRWEWYSRFYGVEVSKPE